MEKNYFKESISLAQRIMIPDSTRLFLYSSQYPPPYPFVELDFTLLELFFVDELVFVGVGVGYGYPGYPGHPGHPGVEDDFFVELEDEDFLVEEGVEEVFLVELEVEEDFLVEDGGLQEPWPPWPLP